MHVVKCPHCNAPTDVLETRPYKKGAIYRTRICFNEHKFRTFEVLAEHVIEDLRPGRSSRTAAPPPKHAP